MAASLDFLHFHQTGLEMIFSSLVEIRGGRHFHMSTISTPYGGPACPGHGRPAPAVGAWDDRGGVVRVVQFGVRSLHGGFG
jgi:hypothetical protein